MNNYLSVFSFLAAALILAVPALAPRAQAQTPTADSFNPAPDWYVHGLALQLNGQVLAGGEFSSLGGQWRSYLGRLNSDGSLDASFTPTVGGQVYCIFVQPDGKILAGGRFVALGGQSRPCVGRLNADGTLDASFNPGANGGQNAVYSLALQADGKVLVGGSFAVMGAQNCANVGRLNADGTLDAGFTAGANGTVYGLALQTNGQIIVCGSFTTLAGAGCTNFGRLNADGSFDASFLGRVNDTVFSLVVQPDGKTLVGGRFTSLAGQSCTNLGRLNPDSSLDGSFSPAPTAYGYSAYIYTLALQTDGKIVVGGGFSTLGEQPCNYLGRVNPDGSLDTTYSPVVNGSVICAGLQASGELLAGGYLSILGGQSRSYFGRLNPTDPVTLSLTFDGSTATWLRGGAGPEVWRTTLEVSTNATDWVSLGAGQRIAGGWQWTGFSYPTNVNFRARGFVTGGQYNGSGWFVETDLGLQVNITSQPISRTNNATTIAAFSVGADGAVPLTYRWRKDGLDLSDGGNVAGAAGPILTVSNVLRADQGAYSVVLSNFSGSVTSAVATLSVVDPAIFTQPASQTLSVGGTALFSITAAGTPTLSYQWYRDGGIVAGATNSSLTLTNVQAADAGSAFEVVVPNQVGSVTSVVAYLAVNLATLDSFNPGASGDVVRSLARQADGKVLAGGGFTSLGGQTHNRLGRLNADGSVDATFNLGADNTVYTLAIQADGRILVGGDFQALGGQTRSDLGRLNADGTLDTTFNPGANGRVCSLVLQADGKILAGGSFTMLGGQSRTNFGRLNADGSLDTSFNPGADGPVYSLTMQADGRILVGGSFATLSGRSITKVGRLNADGSLDTSFSSGANGPIYSLAMQADGKVLVGGSFTTLSGQSLTNLGRLNADGSPDTSFNPGPNSAVYSLSIQADGKILVGGDFGTLGGQKRTFLGRLHTDGTADMTFDPGANNSIYSLSLQADGMVLVGGRFTTLGGQSRSYLGRLYNTETATDSLSFDGSTIAWRRGTTAPEVWRTTFDVSTNGADWTSLGTGQRVPGGWAVSELSLPGNVNLRARGFCAGGQYNGTSWFVETAFGPPLITRQPVSAKTLTNALTTFSVAAAGSPLLGYQWCKDGSALGSATNAVLNIPSPGWSDAGNYQVVVSNGFGSVTSAVAVLTVVGTALPDSFNPGGQGPGIAAGVIYSQIPQVDGKILVGGSFDTLAGQSRNYLGRLNADGSADPAFNPGPNGVVYSLALQVNGKILVGGAFSALGGQGCPNLGRLNADGNLDTAFHPAANGTVLCLAMQADGKILAGGSFTSLGGQTCNYLGRLNADGSLDTTFNPGANGAVYSVTLQGDGKILVGGGFTTLAGQTRNYLGRLNADGSVDTSFNPGADGTVYCLSLQADGKIVVGGTFASLGGESRARLGRLNADGSLDVTFNPGISIAPGWALLVYSLAVQNDGAIIVGGVFNTLGGQSRSFIGRLNADGTTDSTFNPGTDGNVFSLAIQGDGKILVGGSYNTLGGQSRKCLGRLSNTEPATDSLSFDGSTVTWLRGGTGPEVWRTTFDASTNGTDWISLGEGQRTAGGWQRTGPLFPANANVRARGFCAGGQDCGSGWFVETSLGPPYLTLQPVGAKGLINTPVTFSVAAAGSAPFGYQWYKDGTALANATNSVFSIPNLGWGDVGNYQVVVSNGFGSVTSVVAVLTVVTPVVLDPFNPGASGYVYALMPQVDGRILVGGSFGALSGQSRTNLGRLNADSSLDTSFNAGANGTVSCLAVQTDGRIIVGGSFTKLCGQSRTNLGRLNADGSLDTTFSAGTDGAVRCFALQPDGKILLGGAFGLVCGQPQATLARLNADGSLDATFNPTVTSPMYMDNSVYALALQPDGRIMVGGGFANLCGQSRPYLGRLNADGTLDASFTPLTSSAVSCLAVQADAKILVGGGVATLGRFNADGTLDTTFTVTFSRFAAVYSVAPQADGKIVVGGSFDTLAGQSRSYLGRLNADGSLDASFAPSGPNTTVYAVALQADGKILVGGWFTSLEGQSRPYIGRYANTEAATDSLAFDGSTITWLRGGTGPEVWRTTFDVSTNGTNWVSVGDGQPIAGGWQRTGLAFPTNASLRARGFVTGGEYNGTSWSVESTVWPPFITQQPLGVRSLTNTPVSLTAAAVGTLPLSYQWLKSGSAIGNATNSTFSIPSLGWSDAGNYQVVVSNRWGSVTSIVAVVTVLPPAVPDSFNPGAGGSVYTLIPQADGQILAGGSFSSLAGQVRASLGRLKADGTLDTAFNPGGSGIVYCLGLQTDGKILVGGNFTSLGGQSRTNLGRLNTDGSPDTAFNPIANGPVYSMALQADGRIVVGGSFTTLGGQARANLGRLNADGSPDASFNPGAGAAVYSLALQADGRILAGGTFLTLGGQSRVGLGRLTAAGSLDATFNPGSVGTVYSLALQADGKVLAGLSSCRRFNADGNTDATFSAPTANGPILSLAVQADGMVLVAGSFTTLGGQSRSNLARLNINGTLDSTFNPAANAAVYGLALQTDGKVLAGGAFSKLGGQSRSALGRLTNTEAGTDSLAFDGRTMTWLRGGTGPEVWHTTFDVSTNGTDWVSVGEGQRTAGSWQWNGLSLPTNATVRARGFAMGGQYNGTSWFVETVMGSPVITRQPASVKALTNMPVSFSVVAVGSTPLGYQWRKDGSAIGNATNSIFSIASLDWGDGGNYQVVVSNSFGSVTSSVARLSFTTRAMILAGTNAPPGSTITVPVELLSDDDEHSLAFSVAYDTNLLSFVSATRGVGATNGTFTATPGVGKVGVTLVRPAGVCFTNGVYEVARLSFNLANVSNTTVTTLTFADAPTPRLVQTTNNLALPTTYSPGGVAITPTDTIVPSGSSSLFTQVIRVTNPANAGGAVSAVRVWFYNLGVDSKGYAIRVYNATGISNGVPFILWNGPLAPGSSVDLTVEYYIADRTTMPHPRIVVEFPGAQAFTVPVGTALSATFQFVNGNGVVEFSTLAGRTYYVQYAADAAGAGGWRTALPAVTGSGGIIQWVDDGPPKTESAPATVPSRFYRVWLAQ